MAASAVDCILSRASATVVAKAVTTLLESPAGGGATSIPACLKGARSAIGVGGAEHVAVAQARASELGKYSTSSVAYDATISAFV